jgi:hypothetical protein
MPKQVTAIISIPNLDPINDTASWSFEFESDTATDFSNISAVITACQNFVTTAGTGGAASIGFYLSASVDRATNHAAVTVYDITGHLDGSPHGSPVAMQNFTIPVGSGSAQAFPEGCAAALSFRGDYGTDVEFGGSPPGRTRPRARDRNRVYIGPLSSVCAQKDATTGRCEWSSTFVTDALAALFSLSGTHTAGGDAWNFRVWSKKDAALKLPTESWMDNRVDYQRRRSDEGGVRVYRALASV